jgi:hypothetical protein
MGILIGKLFIRSPHKSFCKFTAINLERLFLVDMYILRTS